MGDGCNQSSQWLFKENHTYGTSHKILRVFPRARLGKTPSSRWAMPFRDFASEHRALFVAAVRPASWWKARPETISLSFSLARTHRQGVVDIPGTLLSLFSQRGCFPSHVSRSKRPATSPNHFAISKFSEKSCVSLEQPRGRGHLSLFLRGAVPLQALLLSSFSFFLPPTFPKCPCHTLSWRKCVRARVCGGGRGKDLKGNQKQNGP